MNWCPPRRQAREKARTGLANLKVGYNRVHGYFIELPSKQAEQAPAAYIRRQTLKGAERFITPELKEFEDKALSAKSRALAREKMLYEALLEDLISQLAPLQDTAAALAELDVLSNLAERALNLDLNCPRFVSEPCMRIVQGRHPVVEQVLTTPFVANDLSLDDDTRMLVITGPNMGGKSTYMRQTALIVLLAHIGSFVPAASCELSLVDRIFTRIGSSDDLAGGRSTFMVEMSETANILHNATERSLVLWTKSAVAPAPGVCLGRPGVCGRKCADGARCRIGRCAGQNRPRPSSTSASLGWGACGSTQLGSDSFPGR